VPWALFYNCIEPHLRDPRVGPPENLKTVISGSLANLESEVDNRSTGHERENDSTSEMRIRFLGAL